MPNLERPTVHLTLHFHQGDLLYIPPYWAHAVLSVDASVSLAAFSASWEGVIQSPRS